MIKELNLLPEPLRTINKFIPVIMYVVFVSFFIKKFFPDASPFAKSLWFQDNMIMLGVIILFMAPFSSMLTFLFILRIEQLLLTGNIKEYFKPSVGSLANPVIDDIIGTKGVRFINMVVKVLLVLLVVTFSWVIYSGMK